MGWPPLPPKILAPTNKKTSKRVDSHDLLNPYSIKKKAKLVEGCRELDFDKDLKVISFLKTTEDSKGTTPDTMKSQNSSYTNKRMGNKERNPDIARINVYYESGTVGICRVLNGEVREIFKRFCSMKTLMEVLKHPPYLTYFDSQTLELDQWNDESSENAHTNEHSGIVHINSIKDRIKEVEQKMELADIGIAILGAEKDTLQQTIKDRQETIGFKETSLGLGRNGNVRNNREEKENAQQRSQFIVQLPSKTTQFVKDSLNAPDTNIVGVTTNGIGTVVLYEYGNCVFTPRIPPKLKEKLDIRKRTHVRKPPVYVSLGTKNRFYIKLNNGDHEWAGCTSMSKCLKNNHKLKEVSSVAFGKRWKSYFIVFTDGSWEYGDEIPKGLQQWLYDRRNSADLACVSIGPNYEWFVRTKRDKLYVGGVSKQLLSTIDSIKHRIVSIDFGLTNSFIVQYK